jgi:hypothetical protein
MKWSQSFYKVCGLTIIASCLILLLSHCAAYMPEKAHGKGPTTQTHPVAHEGGIVGTGNDVNCKDNQDKSRCNENVR